MEIEARREIAAHAAAATNGKTWEPAEPNTREIIRVYLPNSWGYCEILADGRVNMDKAKRAAFDAGLRGQLESAGLTACRV
ncbi:hypothetical protein [Solidesulfovibrio alcoholivorans]|uniref:hypothetical protein n=1 Tax=Solidesulfovibrio alcoholivorans TaxID=81406 RepID=UPI000498256B|nr:hypothetical protein [Solidesulfovibrio alcoholivorans]